MSRLLNTRVSRTIAATAITLSMALSAVTVPLQLNAQGKVVDCGPGDLFGCKQVGGTGGTGLSYAPPGAIVLKIIQLAMGFLGLVAVVIILYGGFKWMTAAGNEEKVEEAKKLIGAGIIGMVIIIAAYSIVAFVLRSLFSITTGGTAEPRY